MASLIPNLRRSKFSKLSMQGDNVVTLSYLGPFSVQGYNEFQEMEYEIFMGGKWKLKLDGV